MPEITQEQKTILFGLIIALVIGAGVTLWRSLGPAPATVTIEDADESSTGIRHDVSERSTLTVHLTGCVRKPGVYSMRLGDRVVDLVRQAGGVYERADLDAVNLSAKLSDGQKIEIFPRSEMLAANVPPAVSPPGTSRKLGGAIAKINLNRANLKELDSLPGIGPRTAQAILDYRKTHGRFSDLEELKNIKGFGKSKIDKLVPFITLH
jgi:competence protein ComEA